MTTSSNFIADYLTFSRASRVVFQPVTPRAYLAFAGLPVDEHGAYRATDDGDANALFERMAAQGLTDFTLG